MAKNKASRSQRVVAEADAVEARAAMVDLTFNQGDQCETFTIQPKVFKSGAPGWWGQAKITVDGVRYQAQVQVVRVKGQ